MGLTHYRGVPGRDAAEAAQDARRGFEAAPRVLRLGSWFCSVVRHGRSAERREMCGATGIASPTRCDFPEGFRGFAAASPERWGRFAFARRTAKPLLLFGVKTE